MKIARIFILFLIFCSLYGCFEIIDRPRIDVDEAHLYSPKGKFDFEIDKKYKARVHTSDGTYYVSITLFPIDKVNYLKIESIKKHSIKVNTADSYYQLNKGDKLKFDIKGSRSSRGHFIISAPKTIDRFTVNGGVMKVITPEDGMSKIKRKHMRKMNKDTYHYYIPFTADNEKYTIDVTFRLTTSTSLKFGTPGVP